MLISSGDQLLLGNMIEILLFTILGLIVGILFGLIPGLHPNTIVLLVPMLAQLSIAPLALIAFVVALGISNTFVDFIPSILLGAPGAGSELSVLPGHKLLMEGNGYDAVKLAVIGGLGSIILVTILLPLILFTIPSVYETSRPFTYALLIFIVLVMVSREKGLKKATALLCFLLAGLIGIFSSSLPVDNGVLLFPIFSGFFGVSILIFSSKQKAKIPKRKREVSVTGRQQRRAIVFGGLGGIVSGLLPGVGSSEIASFASVDKNGKSFLMTLGAITISNTLLSIMALWLIQKSRSGIATVLEQLVQIGFNEFIFIAAVALLVAGLSAIITLKLAKRSISIIEKLDYSLVSKIVIVFIVAMTVLFSGLFGMLLLATCAALGIFARLAGIRRSVLMGVLILPTIVFYLPF